MPIEALTAPAASTDPAQPAGPEGAAYGDPPGQPQQQHSTAAASGNGVGGGAVGRSGGDDTSRGLVPTMGGLPSEVIYYQKMLKQPGGSGPTKRLEEGALDPLTSDGGGYTKPVLGALVTLEQSWTASGLAFGQLLNSVSLAPGESTRIAVIDWTRRTKGSREEQTDQIEDLRAIGEQARALSEVSRAVASELQSGTSTQRTESTSAQAGVSGGLGQWLGFSGGVAGNTGVATSVATTSGTKDVAAELAQHVQQRTQQHATSARGRKAAIITETSEQETAVASTRVLTNYNHMHALTIQYFEVVQVYETGCRAVDIEPLLFIPVKVIRFDPASVQPYIATLMAAADDVDAGPPPSGMGQTWKDCIARYRALALVAPAECIPIDDRMKLEEKASGPTQNWPELAHVDPYGDARIKAFPTLKHPNIDGGILVGILVSGGMNGGIEKIEISNSGSPLIILDANFLTSGVEARPNFNIDRMTTVAIHYSADRTKWAKVTLRYRILTPEPLVLILTQDVAPPPTTIAGGAGPFAAIVAWARWMVPVENAFVEQHLNRHAIHYSLAVWRASGVSLTQALDAYSYNDMPVLDQIDPQPVAITGNMIGFRLNEEPSTQKVSSQWWQFATQQAFDAAFGGLSGEQLRTAIEAVIEYDSQQYGVDSIGGEWYGKLKSRLATAARSTNMIALPTGGVFAEAVLGTSNAAEKLDMTRFWNWQESPIPILPPDIAPLSLDSRARDMDLRPQSMEQALVAFQNFDKLPDPTMGQAAAQALMAKIFDDMSNAQKSTEALAKALDLSGAGAKDASAESLAAYQASLEHQREMTRMAVDAAKTLLPMVAPEAMAAGGAGKLLGGAGGGVSKALGGGGLGSLASSAGISRTGAVFNAAEKIDGSSGGSDQVRAVMEAVTGRTASSDSNGLDWFEWIPDQQDDENPAQNGRTGAG